MACTTRGAVAAKYEDARRERPGGEFAGRVNFIQHEEINAVYPRRFPSIVEVITKDGATYTVRVESPKGSQENPLTWNQVREKFMVNSFELIDAEKADEIADRIDHLEELPDVSALAKLMGMEKETK